MVILFCSIFYQITVNTNIYNAVVINKNASKIQKLCVLQVAFFSLKLVRIVFVLSSSLALRPNLYTILAKYFPFSQLHVAEYQT